MSSLYREHCVHSLLSPQDLMAWSLAVTKNGQQRELETHQLRFLKTGHTAWSGGVPGVIQSFSCKDSYTDLVLNSHQKPARAVQLTAMFYCQQVTYGPTLLCVCVSVNVVSTITNISLLVSWQREQPPLAIWLFAFAGESAPLNLNISCGRSWIIT